MSFKSCFQNPKKPLHEKIRKIFNIAMEFLAAMRLNILMTIKIYS